MNESVLNRMMKYIHMTREEDNQFMIESINGKPHYTDSEITFGMFLLATKLKNEPK